MRDKVKNAARARAHRLANIEVYRAREKAKYVKRRERILEQKKEYVDKLPSALRVWRSAKNGARARKIEFDISVIDVQRAWPKDNKCPVFGTDLVFEKGRNKNFSPSLDRLDASRGYVKGNIALISWRANNIKGNATVDEVQRVALWMNNAVQTGNT